MRSTKVQRIPMMEPHRFDKQPPVFDVFLKDSVPTLAIPPFIYNCNSKGYGIKESLINLARIRQNKQNLVTVCDQTPCSIPTIFIQYP